MGILVDLWMQDGLRQQDLVSSVIKDKGTIARALENLEKQGIVTRETDEADRRNKLIYLTPKGRKLKTVMLPHALSAMEEVLVNIPPEEVAICKKVLQRMYKRLTQKLIHSVPATTTSL